MLATDFISSYTVFTYNCRDMSFSPPIGTSIIGFYHNDFPSLRINHGATRREKPHLIACINQPSSPWVNVVYGLSADDSLGEAQVSLGDDRIPWTDFAWRQEAMRAHTMICVLCGFALCDTLLQRFFLYWIISAQLMSVRWIMEAVSRSVQILSSLSAVAVHMDMSWIAMESLAQVTIATVYVLCTIAT